MDLRQLRFFVRAIESSSISQAARSLHITQPSLSQRIKELEAELGVDLLERMPNGVRATETGQMVADRARTILRLADNLMVEARTDLREPAGEVTVGLPTTMALHLTLPLVKVIRADFPKINLRVSEGMSGHIQEWVLSGRLDLAVLYTDDAVEGLSITKITEEDLCLISQADASSTAGEVLFSQLADFPLVLPGPDHGLRRSIEKVRAATQTQLQIAVEVDSLPHLKRLAMDGELHTILPHAACIDEIRQGQLMSRRIVKPNLRRPIVMAIAKDQPNTRAIAAVKMVLNALVEQSVNRETSA